ncbi:MAG: hypothetical protein WBD36_14510 [Bacteroidota bacterium]
MAFAFTEKDVRKIGLVLAAHPKHLGSNYRFEIPSKNQTRKLALEIYSNIDIGKRKGNLVSVYTPNAHLQLHFCTGYVVSKMLGEVTFVGESDGKLSGLTVEREGGCSIYANVDREILSGDFTTLGPEVMLSGIALSLTETVLPSPPMTEDEFLNEVVSRKRGRKARHGLKSKKEQ